jgi:predicted aspartyl protease
MIQGRVTADEAVVPITVHGPSGKTRIVETVLDTGCTEALTLLPEDIAILGLHFQGTEEVILANGNIDWLHGYHGAVVEWQDQHESVYVLEANGGALLGMGLLKGQRVTLDVYEDGPVTIEPLDVGQ